MATAANSLNISQSGIVAFNGVETFSGRTLQAGSGISITNGNGVSGNPTISATGAANDFHVARYIVSSGGAIDGANYTSIAAAYADAVTKGGPQTVFVQPGTYTENLTLSPNVNISAFDCDAYSPNVIILGKLSYSSAGSVSISGVQLKTNGDYFLEVTGSAASKVYLFSCFMQCEDHSGIHFTSSSASSAILVYESAGEIATTGIAPFVSTATGTLQFSAVIFNNTGGSTTASTASTGDVKFQFSIFKSPISLTGSGFNAFIESEIDTASINTTALTTATSGTSRLLGGTLTSGTASALSIGASTTVIASSLNISSSNTNAITGAGTLQYGNLAFISTSSLINTTTQTPQVRSNDAVKVTSPGAYPYTTVPQDNLILVDTSAARTIVPLASPTTGQVHRIKDNVGSGATNNITITPSGKNIDGAASLVINTNFGSVDICYNGTEWSVL